MLAALAANGAIAAKAPDATHIEGPPTLLLGAYDVTKLGYTRDEYFISGNASSYTAPEPLSSDGRWTAAVSGTAPYRTRIVVIRPAAPANFNGTVIVEWLNVSGGLDAPADWFMAHREIMRSGYAYVAISAQKVGIDGGASMGADMSLKKINPERYQSLVHPDDAYAFDIFSQAGELVRIARPGGILGLLVAKDLARSGRWRAESSNQAWIRRDAYVISLSPDGSRLAGNYRATGAGIGCRAAKRLSAGFPPAAASTRRWTEFPRSRRLSGA
jgi:Alpha/beta hydrolase domain